VTAHERDQNKKPDYWVGAKKKQIFLVIFLGEPSIRAQGALYDLGSLDRPCWKRLAQARGLNQTGTLVTAAEASGGLPRNQAVNSAPSGFKKVNSNEGKERESIHFKTNPID
jgi:hypothetical protein